jgi:hypothetical protein
MLAGRPVVEKSTPRQPLTRREQGYAIKTWRYLRIAMVVLAFGLFVSVAIEWLRVDGHCWQESISAYYYTPVHNFFVAVLMSIGVCLFCLKGSTDTEDTLLNVAGMFAPVVALVPTAAKDSCLSVLVSVRNVKAIENNVTALIIIGGIGLLILIGLAFKNPPTKTERKGFIAAASVWLAATLIFFLDEDLFIDNAHYTAAVLMFLCILAVVCINAMAHSKDPSPKRKRNWSAVLAATMLGSSAVILLAAAFGFDHWVLVIEAVLIFLFGAFWIIQTDELWEDGLRPPL